MSTLPRYVGQIPYIETYLVRAILRAHVTLHVVVQKRASILYDKIVEGRIALKFFKGNWIE